MIVNQLPPLRSSLLGLHFLIPLKGKVPLCLFLLIFLFPIVILAEGTKDLTPNPGDRAAIYVGARDGGLNQGDYYNFAYPGSDSKLFIRINDPSCEIIYFGFGAPMSSRFMRSTDQVDGVEWRLVDPNGNPVVIAGITNGSGWMDLDIADANVSYGLSGQAQVKAGPNVAGGYSSWSFGSNNYFTPTLAGDYRVEFQWNRGTSTTGRYIENWDITVAANPGSGSCAPIDLSADGRVWARHWAMSVPVDAPSNNVDDFSFTRSFNGDFFVCSEEGFVTNISFDNGDLWSGFRPGSWNVLFNTSGPREDLSLEENRKSIYESNFQGDLNNLLAVFLNEPSTVTCPEPAIGSLMKQSPFIKQGSDCNPEQYEFCFKSSGKGLVDAFLDLDGQPGINLANGDVILCYEITDSDLNGDPDYADDPNFPYEFCIPWNGRLGSMANPAGDPSKDFAALTIGNASINLQSTFSQGLYNFPVYDVEYNDDGYVISPIRPLDYDQDGTDDDYVKVFWDDSPIPPGLAVGNPPARPAVPGLTNGGFDITNLTGCVFNDPPGSKCHQWNPWLDPANNNFNIQNFQHRREWGNRNILNTWWQAVRKEDDFALFDLPVFRKGIITPESPGCLCGVPGSTLELSGSWEFVGVGTPPVATVTMYQWEGPSGTISQGALGSTDPIPTVNANGLGMYTLTLTFSDGCTISTSYDLNTECTETGAYAEDAEVDVNNSHQLWFDFGKYLPSAKNNSEYDCLGLYWKEDPNDPLTFEFDGTTQTAKLTGTIFNYSSGANPQLSQPDQACVKFKVEIFFREKMSWTEWQALCTTGDCYKADYTGTPGGNFWENWDYYLINDDQDAAVGLTDDGIESTITLICDPGCDSKVCDGTNDPPSTLLVRQMQPLIYALQVGVGANDKNDAFGYSTWYDVVDKGTGGAANGQLVCIQGDINMLGECIDGGARAIPGLTNLSTSTDDNNRVTLLMETDDSRNVLSYNIERSMEGEAFEVIDRLRPDGSVIRGETLSYLDETASADEREYRVQVVYTNGQYAYSNHSAVEGSSLPVEFLHFGAIHTGQQEVKLEWATASESNNAYFEIEKKNGVGVFRPLTRVAGQGDSQEIQEYNYLDQTPMSQRVYYRLRQVDFDGNYAYSSVVEVTFNELGALYAIYPNPVKEVIHVALMQANEGIYTLHLTDIRGRVIHRCTLDAQVSAQQIDVRHLAPGSYMIHIQDPLGQRYTQKIIK